MSRGADITVKTLWGDHRTPKDLALANSQRAVIDFLEREEEEHQMSQREQAESYLIRRLQEEGGTLGVSVALVFTFVRSL